MILDEIAECKTGLVLSRFEGQTPYQILSAKYIDDLGRISQTETFHGGQISKEDRLREGDIAIKIAYPNTAVYIPQEYEGILLSSFFCRVRVESERVDPKFLIVYLNSSLFRKKLYQTLIGSTVKKLKISALKESSIPELTMEKQKKVVEIAKAMKAEEIKRREWCEKQHLFYEKKLNSFMEEE